jgi:hypothetical protein
MKQACLTPAYVCANMTSANLLSDPEVANAYRGALRAGDGGAVAELDAMVAHLRSAYGCGDGDGAGAVEASPAPEAPRLPPGHPPISGQPRLPPGHPPLPSGHPPVPDGPAAPLFESPGTLTI